MRSLPILAFALAALAWPVQRALADDEMTAGEPADNESGFDNVDLLDGSLTGKLGVMRVGSDRSDENTLSILAALKNLTDHPLRLEAQTLYKDANGNWMNGGCAGWIALELKPHGQLNYRSESLSVEAQNFLVRIRLVGTDRLVGASLPDAHEVP
jgi:hypothetical protein